jgi:hypothetical protein
MEPDDLLCSRNARSQTPLVGRAQWKINQPPSLKITSELVGSILEICSLGTRARRGALGVGRVRMLRAVKGSLGHSSQEQYRDLDAARSTRAF